MVSVDETASSFDKLFAYVATSDYMPHLCIPAALRFRQDVCGGEAPIYEYVKRLAKEGGDMVAKILETEVLEEPGLGAGAESQMRDCGIATVRLPLAIATGPSTAPDDVPGGALADEEVGPAVRYLTKALADRYKTWLPIIDYRGWIWARLCAQVYLEISDFEMAGNALKVICEEINKRQMRQEVVDS
jgi:hypothetical protein